MNKDVLIRIMTEPKNSIVKQYQALFALDNIKLDFEKEALEKIAELTIKNKTGARGLRSVIEGILQELMFEMPSKEDISEIIITPETVEGGKPKTVNK